MTADDVAAGPMTTSETGLVGCSQPWHCPCGCGAHVGCFIYGDDAYDNYTSERYESADSCGEAP